MTTPPGLPLSHLGHTRTRVTPRYAFIAPDGHVPTLLPGWQQSQAVMLISPQLGARFTQYLALMEVGGESGSPLAGVERFVYVLEGTVTLEANAQQSTLEPHDYAFIPADTPHTLHAEQASRVSVFERRYLALEGTSSPRVLTGSEPGTAGEPFLGNPNLIVKKLLPDTPNFDLAVNTMTFKPGTPLPFAETHVMEHGMLMLSGGGIYRLGEAWHPIHSGDVLWMGPYCPQWFGALGKEDAKYLLYKEANRDPFRFERES